MYEQAQDKSLTVHLEKETCTLKGVKMMTGVIETLNGGNRTGALFRGREKVS